MNRAARLEPLAEFAGKVENEAARRLAVSAKALAAKEHEVEQLRSYLAEYRQRAELDERGTDTLRWQNARAFLAKLSELVATREAELHQAVVNYRLEADRWRDSHRRAESLERIVAEGERDLREARAKRDQSELDEQAILRVLERG